MLPKMIHGILIYGIFFPFHHIMCASHCLSFLSQGQGPCFMASFSTLLANHTFCKFSVLLAYLLPTINSAIAHQIFHPNNKRLKASLHHPLIPSTTRPFHLPAAGLQCLQSKVPHQLHILGPRPHPYCTHLCLQWQ